MNTKDFLNSKGISNKRQIDVRGDLNVLLGRVKLADLLEEYHQEQLKLLNIDNVRLCFPTNDDIEDIADATIKENKTLNNDVSYWERVGFKDGAKWAIEMIKNSNKWK